VLALALPVLPVLAVLLALLALLQRPEQEQASLLSWLVRAPLRAWKLRPARPSWALLPQLAWQQGQTPPQPPSSQLASLLQAPLLPLE
jgi:hypothetical protein